MLQITFRHMTSSETLRTVAEERFEKIQGHLRVTARCHLVVDNCAAHACKGDHFVAHAELTVHELDLRIEANATHEQAATAVRRVFEHMERQLASRNGRNAALLRAV